MSSIATLQKPDIILKPPEDILEYPVLAKTGRPRKYKSPHEMLPLIKQYFTQKVDSKEPMLVCGLCNALDISDETLQEYENLPEFSSLIKKARQTIKEDVISGAMKNRYNNAMSIFYCKNAFGMTDRQEITERKDPEVIQMMKDFIERKSK